MPAVTPAERHDPERYGSSKRHPARRTARSTSTRRPLWGRLFVWGRLSSLRPAFQPALAPFTHRPLHHPMPRHVGADQRVRPACSLLHRPLPRWSKPPGLPCRRSRRQSHTIPGCAGVRTPSAAKTGGVARKTACSTSRRRPQRSMPPGLPCGRPGRQSKTTRAVREFPRHPPPRLAAWHARLRAPPQGAARKTACSTSRGRASLWLQARRPAAS